MSIGTHYCLVAYLGVLNYVDSVFLKQQYHGSVCAYVQILFDLPNYTAQTLL